jgi:hypothetical protein
MGAIQSGLAHSPSPHFRESCNIAPVSDSLSRYPLLAVRPPSGSCSSHRPSTRRLRALLGGWFEVRDFREPCGKRTPKNLMWARERHVSTQDVVELGARTKMPIGPARLSQPIVSQLGGIRRNNFWVLADGARRQKPLIAYCKKRFVEAIVAIMCASDLDRVAKRMCLISLEAAYLG